MLNGSFVDITNTLGIACEEIYICKIHSKRLCSPSIVKIRAIVISSRPFSFCQITVQEMFNRLIKLDPKKATPQEAIPAKILQANADLFSS